MNQWTLRPLPSHRDLCVEWVEPGELLVSRGNRLFRETASTAEIKQIFELPAAAWMKLIARLRLAARGLRFAFYNVLKVSNEELFVSFGRTVGAFGPGGYRPLEGLERPCRILRGAAAADSSGSIVFGEYIPNLNRQDAINIYERPPNSDRVHVVHQFQPGQVRHVHGIFHDPYDRSLWCLTGDVAHENRMIRTSDKFKTWETVGAGDETWRAVSVQFRRDGIYYATDAEFRQNHIFRIDRRTGTRERLTDVDGPVYYSHHIGDDLFFGVTAELCPSQRDRSASLWHVSTHDQCSTVATFEKDAYSPRWFLPGAFYFPAGPGAGDRSFVQTVAFESCDNATFCLERE